jgi:prepilin-type N-terminal cleavage/methylation domain-containing protein
VKQARAGFTIVEVLIAVMILSVGVVAMAGSSALVTRMIGRAKSDTRAAQLATQRIEMLRVIAASTNPRCTALANGAATTDNVALAWTVVAPAGGGRNLVVTATYATPGGPQVETLTTFIEC